MSLLDERVVYKPFEYPKAFDYWLKQQQAHWLHTEVPMSQDVTDWKSNLKDHEKDGYDLSFHSAAQWETTPLQLLLLSRMRRRTFRPLESMVFSVSVQK